MEFKPKNIDFMQNFWTRFEDLPLYSTFITQEGLIDTVEMGKLWIKISDVRAITLDAAYQGDYCPGEDVHQITKVTVEWEI